MESFSLLPRISDQVTLLSFFVNDSRERGSRRGEAALLPRHDKKEDTDSTTLKGSVWNVSRMEYSLAS